MKTLIIIVVLWASVAGAAPYLTCDVDTNCEYYKVYADDVMIADNVAAPLNYDLKDMTPGVIDFDAECCNYWGCEKTVNPTVSLDAPGVPQNMNLKQ